MKVSKEIYNKSKGFRFTCNKSVGVSHNIDEF